MYPAFPNYSVCGLPYFVSGETPDWHDLAHRTEFGDIAILPDRRADEIDRQHKQVVVHGTDGAEARLRYDKLIIATGASAAPARVGYDPRPGRACPAHRA